MRRSTTYMLLVPLLLATGGAVTTAAAQRPTPVFSPPGARLTAEPTAALPRPGDVRYLKWRVARVELAAFDRARSGETMRFNLFEDADLEVVIDEVVLHGRQGRSLLGHVDGVQPSNVVLERLGDVLVGMVALPGRSWAIRYAGNGLHTLHEVNPAAFAVADEPLPVAPVPAAPVPPVAKATAKQTITYLGLYTADALKAQGGKKAMKAAIRLTVTWLAAALKAQKVKHKIKFRGAKKIKGADNGDLNDALQGVTTAGDGSFDKAQALRNKKAADFVGLYIKGDGTGFGTCGLGWQVSNFSPFNERWAYHTVREDCNVAGGGKTGAHETLHNMGGCHPETQGSCTGPTNASYGKIVRNANVRASFRVDAHTTLGTGAICPACMNLRTVSGKKKFNGNKVGDTKANIAAMVNQGAATYAGYR